MKGLEIRAYEILQAEEKINSKKDIFLTKEDKTDMIKWMFIFWIGQLGAMAGLILLFTKK